MKLRRRQEQHPRNHNDPHRVYEGTFLLEPCTEYPRNDPGITHDKNRAPQSARRLFPFCFLAPTWCDYEALKKSYPTYSSTSFETDGEMTSEPPTIGLLKGQRRLGLIKGSFNFVHIRNHKQGSLDSQDDTYFNFVRFSVPPAHFDDDNVFIGHIFGWQFTWF